MVHNINNGKGITQKELSQKISGSKLWNKRLDQFRMFTLGGFVVGMIILGTYVAPRKEAYMNAIRVAHTHPDVVEQLKDPTKITKEGPGYKLTLTK